MKIGIIVQARMGSTRLSGKVLKKIKGKTILNHVVTRLKQSTFIDTIIVATTDNSKDLDIVNETQILETNVFRGSEDDVLSRYYHAAKENDLDIIIRVTSDCPLIDPKVLDEMIELYLKGNYEVITNVGMEVEDRTYPRGLDVEIFNFGVLEVAYHNATKKYQREHVTPYIYENTDKIYFYKNSSDYSKYRWTVDTLEDFELITTIYSYLYKGKHDFYLENIIELFDTHPELYEINAEIKQKKIKDVD